MSDRRCCSPGGCISSPIGSRNEEAGTATSIFLHFFRSSSSSHPYSGPLILVPPTRGVCEKTVRSENKQRNYANTMGSELALIFLVVAWALFRVAEALGKNKENECVHQ